MKVDDIFAMWELDSSIDRSELGDEALKIPKLHHKYYRTYVNEKLTLRKLEADLKKLKFDKHEFYSQGPNETTPLHWKLPAVGKVIRSDVQFYVDSDQEVITLSLKIGVQQEKVELLESIIKSLSNRGYQISSAIQWERFKMGV